MDGFHQLLGIIATNQDFFAPPFHSKFNSPLRVDVVNHLPTIVADAPPNGSLEHPARFDITDKHLIANNPDTHGKLNPELIDQNGHLINQRSQGKQHNCHHNLGRARQSQPHHNSQ